MTTHEIPHVRRFQSGTLAAQAASIVTHRRRFHAWFRGWRDGRQSLHGTSNSSEIVEVSYFLRKVHSHAESLRAGSDGALRDEELRLQELEQKLRERIGSITATLSEMERHAAGIRCERPTASRASYGRLLIFLFVAEVAFSYLNLMYADMGGFIVEAVLALVFAGCLVGLSHTIGQRYRRLPLALDEPPQSTTKIRIEIAVFMALMVGVLVGLTYLRARGLRMRGGDSDSELFVEIALFVIGFGFLAYAAWVAGQVEYSGPKYGAAALEFKKRQANDLLVSVDGEIKKVEAFRGTLEGLFARHEDRIRNIYLDQYRTHERK